jgi:hypothetical protein
MGGQQGNQLGRAQPTTLSSLRLLAQASTPHRCLAACWKILNSMVVILLLLLQEDGYLPVLVWRVAHDCCVRPPGGAVGKCHELDYGHIGGSL